MSCDDNNNTQYTTRCLYKLCRQLRERREQTTAMIHRFHFMAMAKNRVAPAVVLSRRQHSRFRCRVCKTVLFVRKSVPVVVVVAAPLMMRACRLSTCSFRKRYDSMHRLDRRQQQQQRHRHVQVQWQVVRQYQAVWFHLYEAVQPIQLTVQYVTSSFRITMSSICR